MFTAHRRWCPTARARNGELAAGVVVHIHPFRRDVAEWMVGILDRSSSWIRPFSTVDRNDSWPTARPGRSPMPAGLDLGQGGVVAVIVGDGDLDAGLGGRISSAVRGWYSRPSCTAAASPSALGQADRGQQQQAARWTVVRRIEVSRLVVIVQSFLRVMHKEQRSATAPSSARSDGGNRVDFGASPAGGSAPSI